jgi:hypothetical protein
MISSEKSARDHKRLELAGSNVKILEWDFADGSWGKRAKLNFA